jgi:hypothetical protein
MLVTGTRIETENVLQVDNLLLHSCKDLTLCCTSDLISSNLAIVISEALNIWKQGKTTNLVILSPADQELVSFLIMNLPYPFQCQLLETNRYNRVVSSLNLQVSSPEDLTIPTESKETFKVLKIFSSEKTFLTSRPCFLNLMMLTVKISTKLEQ